MSWRVEGESLLAVDGCCKHWLFETCGIAWTTAVTARCIRRKLGSPQDSSAYVCWWVVVLVHYFWCCACYWQNTISVQWPVQDLTGQSGFQWIQWHLMVRTVLTTSILTAISGRVNPAGLVLAPLCHVCCHLLVAMQFPVTAIVSASQRHCHHHHLFCLSIFDSIS